MDTRKCHEVVSVSPKPLPLYEVGITVYFGKRRGFEGNRIQGDGGFGNTCTCI